MKNKYLSSWYIIDKLNKHKLTSGIYPFLKQHIKRGDFSFDSLLIPRPVKTNHDKKRLNIIIPSLRKYNVFGGINTALSFFESLITKTNFEGRIIINERESYDPNLTINISKYKENGIQVHFLNDKLDIDISENDYFIFTTWKSAYVFNKVVNWQEKKYRRDFYSIYLIQDYEPGFVAWSTEFALAESTYKINTNRIIAVFNSKELYDYFKFNKYNFFKEYYFKPSLNKKLKQNLLALKNLPKREKLIIVYGRPNAPRNAFELLRESLSIWSFNYSDASSWRILSIGAPNKNIKLANNVIECKGKLTLQEYSELMTKAYAGVSLMISPHPSYPPLEMSTYGVKTITNDFMNKHMNGFNSNLYSVSNCLPEVIAKQLIEICKNYDGNGIPDLNDEYLNGNDFKKVINQVAQDILKI